MKQLYSARNGLEAQDLRFYLDAHGIDSKVFGDNNALETVFAFTPSSAPGVFVHEADFSRAAELLETFLSQPDVPTASGQWRCAKCSELVGSQFDACWNCESPRGDVAIENFARLPSTSSDTAMTETKASNLSSMSSTQVPYAQIPVQSRRDIWLEVLVVLAVAWFPYFAYSLFSDSSASESNQSFAVESLWTITNCVPIIVVVLYVMHCSTVPWAKFGVKRPRWLLDPLMGIAVWMTACVFLVTIQLGAATAFGSYEVFDFGRSSYEFAGPSTAIDLAIAVLLCFAIGLSEELAMRGYLIPRLEQLLGSSAISVLLSSLVFASYHLYQGIGATMWIFIIGIAFGVAFCLMRRLWPMAIAHAIMDIVAISAGG